MRIRMRERRHPQPTARYIHHHTPRTTHHTPHTTHHTAHTTHRTPHTAHRTPHTTHHATPRPRAMPTPRTWCGGTSRPSRATSRRRPPTLRWRAGWQTNSKWARERPRQRSRRPHTQAQPRRRPTQRPTQAQPRRRARPLSWPLRPQRLPSTWIRARTRYSDAKYKISYGDFGNILIDSDSDFIFN